MLIGKSALGDVDNCLPQLFAVLLRYHIVFAQLVIEPADLIKDVWGHVIDRVQNSREEAV